MKHLESFLEESLEAWVNARQGIIAEVENIPEEHLDFSPTPEMRSVAELVRHILEVSMFMTAELTRPDTELARYPFSELRQRYAPGLDSAQTKAELIDRLSSQMDQALDEFRRAGELSQWQFVRRFDGEQGTKMQWLHHGIAQEMYHRGQLTVYARLLGLEPALTRRIKSS